MRSISTKFLVATFFILLALAGCKAKAQKDPSPNGYDLNNGVKFLMPESLFEISGICFYKGNPDTIYAIQDEEGKVFRLAYGVKKQEHTKFGKKGDYEDVAIAKDNIYVLKSTGILYSFPFADRVVEEVDNAKEWTGILPEGEYEGMCVDDSTGNIFVICKNCKDDDQKNALSGYIISTGDSVYQSGTFSVDVNQIKAISGKVKKGFKPSAMARNPLTGDWYIISSINKLLVVTDRNWKVKESIELSTNTFTQPEGLAFDHAGNMYISNEGDDLSQGNIIKFALINQKSK